MTTEVPDTTDIGQLRAAARSCTRCDLYRDATQVVFGEGPSDASTFVVGEQPGDQEDRAGRPFVGPAGRLLDRAFQDAGIDRSAVYLTNAVKHFKFRQAERGKRRITQKPSRAEVMACRPWLFAELRAVRPELVLCLGATAAQSLMGPRFKVTEHRGRLLGLPEEIGLDARLVVTVHPSAVLRAPDRGAAYQAFVADLKVASRG
jgi:DNA polymerase